LHLYWIFFVEEAFISDKCLRKFLNLIFAFESTLRVFWDCVVHIESSPPRLTTSQCSLRRKLLYSIRNWVSNSKLAWGTMKKGLNNKKIVLQNIALYEFYLFAHCNWLPLTCMYEQHEKYKVNWLKKLAFSLLHVLLVKMHEIYNSRPVHSMLMVKQKV
jgi:hypothetical protein